MSYEFLIHTQHNQHVDLFCIERRIPLVTHVIGPRKNTFTETFCTQSPYLTAQRRSHERKPPTPVCPRLALRCACTRNQRWARWGPRRCRVLKDVSKSEPILSLWRTSQNNSKNIKFTKKNWIKIKKWSILTFFFGHDRDLVLPPGHLVIIFMIAFVTWNSNLVPLLEGLWTSNPCRFQFWVFWVFAGIKPTTSGLTVPRSDRLS